MSEADTRATGESGTIVKVGGQNKERNKPHGRPTEKPSRVSPKVAAILSALVPGLGQAFARRIQRGAILFVGAVSVVGMLIWRISILGTRVEGGWETFIRAVERRPSFVLFVIAAGILMWVLNVVDAYRVAERRPSGQPGTFFALIAALFVLGWQVSEIDVGTAVARVPEALPLLGRIVWPWDAAIEYEETVLQASAPILVSPEGETPEPPPSSADEPYVRVEPREGQLAVQNLQTMRQTPGTRVTVTGFNFEPNTETEIWWLDDADNEFPIRQQDGEVQATTDANGTFTATFTLPFPMIGGEPDQEGTLHRVSARQRSFGDATASQALLVIISRMVETIVLGMMATLFGIVFSIPVSFLAARNIMSGSKITMAIYYFVRFIMNVIRSIEPLIWALIATVWVGLGPFAGIIALTMHSVAALSKLYSEAIEGIDPGPIEAIQATGANRLQTIAYAIIPQMISPFVSFSIYRWDINVRMSTVIGLVGGGGVGFILIQYIRLLNYRAAGIAVWFIAVTVALLDYVSAEIRNKLA
ncbi:MAG: phosphonate ABC transporter, permease protein PhnE [Spirochaetales bacterium]